MGIFAFGGFILLTVGTGFLITEKYVKISTKEDSQKNNIVLDYVTPKNNNNSDEWCAENYIDEFGDKIDKRFIRYKASGLSRNTSIEMLLGSNIFKLSLLNRKDKNLISFKNFNGIAKNEKGERFNFSHNQKGKLVDFMSTSKEVRFILNSGYTYKFTINCEKLGYYIVTENLVDLSKLDKNCDS